MATMDKASPRDRLLDAAVELTYREGVNIGVDALCRAAGVSKRSMYQLFDSKEEMLAAGLKSRIEGYESRFRADPEQASTPRERILYVFRQLTESADEPGYCGCPYLAALVELKDPEHPAHVVSREAKDRLKSTFRELAELGGAHDPDLLARQLTLVFDGASARSGAGVETLADGLALTMATTLLDAAGVA
ncbi:TetR/AcrR family transcriptional regulator [Streptomyces sp. NPDC088387]|uniref:TetR/AcrR family transcriptional regulator n=1 Tax=Streptomyces sp. NPDC088387 TaxID=3365859 RepID=UPI00381ED656